MRSIKNSLFVLILLIFQLSQGQTINALQIHPVNPNSSQTVFVIATEQFPYSGCQRISWIVNANTNTVMVFSSHQMGMLTAICNYVDTIPVGQLLPGNYTLIFYLLNDQNGQTWDSDTLQFSVSGTVGLDKNERKKNIINVYPNPGTGIFHLAPEYADREISIVVYNTLGEELSNIGKKDKNGRIDLSNQADGIYMVKVSSTSGENWIRLIKKENN